LLRNDPDRPLGQYGTNRPRLALEVVGRVWIETWTAVSKHEIEQAVWEQAGRLSPFDKEAEKIVRDGGRHLPPVPVGWPGRSPSHRAQALTAGQGPNRLGALQFGAMPKPMNGALSRCRTLDGLALARPLIPSDILFHQQARATPPRLTRRLG